MTTVAADAFPGAAVAFCDDFAGEEAFADAFLPAADLADFFAGAGLDAMMMTYASVLVFVWWMGVRAKTPPLSTVVVHHRSRRLRALGYSAASPAVSETCCTSGLPRRAAPVLRPFVADDRRARVGSAV